MLVTLVFMLQFQCVCESVSEEKIMVDRLLVETFSLKFAFSPIEIFFSKKTKAKTSLVRVNHNKFKFCNHVKSNLQLLLYLL